MPVLNGLTELITTKIEMKRGKYTLQIAKCNNQIEKISSEQPSAVSRIGFELPDDEIELEDDEDDL